MKPCFLCLALSLLVFPILAQDHILVDCVHGANYFASPDGMRDVDLQAIFPNDIITIVTPDTLVGITNLVDTITNEEGVLTFTIDLPASSPADCIQTLYVNLVDYNDFFSFVSGTITNPNGELVQNLYAGNGHVDNAYGAGWTVQIQFAIETLYEPKHIRIGYGNTLFSSSTHTGLYNPADYDAFLSLYNNYYFALLEDSPDFSDTDTETLTAAFQNGLSMMLSYNYATVLPVKPFIHMYTKEDMDASVQLTVPGKRTLAMPKPEGDVTTFGWKDIQLKPNSMNEHLWESASNQRFNFIDFYISGTGVTYRNQTDTPLYDLMLIKNVDSQHFRIGYNNVLKQRIHYQMSEWNTYNTMQTKDFLKAEMYKQCTNVGLNDKEAYHFAYELPWVDVLILRAMKHPDQYFGFYHFDNAIFDRLVPLDIHPYPTSLERNMWVLLSNIQPRQSESCLTLNPLLVNDKPEKVTKDFVYREYGMVDEHYSMSNAYRDMSFFGFDINGYSELNMPIESYTNPFANELAEYAPSLVMPDGSLTFNIDDPGQHGVFHYTSDSDHPIVFAKSFLGNGRLMVLGAISSFIYTSQYPFMNAAMHSLIHSPNLVVGNIPPISPEPGKVHITNYPNPFNPETTIQFSIPAKGNVDISLYNIKGQLIKQLISANMEEGMHSNLWNGLNQYHAQVASQVIMCRMHYQDHDYTKKIVLMK